jgi:hypothetical protein
VTYFGGVGAELIMPDTDNTPQRNWNDTEYCPNWWTFWPRSGAVFQLCPYLVSGPYEIQEASAMSVDLSFNPDDLDRNPLTSADLSNIFITNGSVRGPFAYDVTPAVISLEESENTEPVLYSTWSVNGTQEAFLTNDPSATSYVSFDCSKAYGDDSGGYCGTFYDRQQGGCWSMQKFSLHNQTTTNFSVRFNNDLATVDIWTVQPWIDKNGTDLGDIQVHVKFSGKRDLPSITEYSFWENSDTTYEVGQTLVNDIELREDSARMPLFYNDTKSKEWYSSGNGTYSDSGTAINSYNMWMSSLTVSASIGLILVL